jgi:hypothetical protein
MGSMETLQERERLVQSEGEWRGRTRGAEEIGYTFVAVASNGSV